ncbi:fungal-specific transcription factor domain-containing protein [Rhizoctonia solani]|nr:fungal-specific transcription factor domain-containing protein [Rhizoctonia solani]
MAVVSSQTIITSSPQQGPSGSFVSTGQHALPGPSRRGRGRPPGSGSERTTTDSSLSAASTGPVASTRTKNGCWSCRVRRKKCDEGATDRVGSCGNCTRLEIECLGWGAKRPEWMKNKCEVEAWKARVTQSLKDKGMIRGVPRTNAPAQPPFTTNPRVGRNVTPPESTHSQSPVSPVVNVIPGAGPIPRNFSGSSTRTDPPRMLPSPPDINGHVPTQSPIHDLSEESDNEDYGFGDLTDPSDMTPALFSDSSILSDVPMMMSMPNDFAQTNTFDQTTSVFTEVVEELVSPEVRAGASAADFTTPYDFTAPTGVAPSVIFGPIPPYVNAGNEWSDYNGYQQTDYTNTNWNANGYAYTSTPNEAPPPYQEQSVQSFQPRVLHTPTVRLDQDRLRNMLILYYFKHVRQMQYVFAGDTTTNVMWQHANMDPQGVVSLALCSLAALHDSRMRIANGIMSNDQRARGPADKYYQKALARLQDNKQRNGILTDADATAALHFVSFWLFTGGTGDWPTALQIAGDWYEQSNLANEENPMKALMDMNDNAKHASKTTMWMDIFSSISLCKSPRFLTLYRRLLQPNWYPTGQRSGLQLENIMGCADGIMLCLAEIADLACWKAQQQANGCLSMPELVRRGLVIEKDLRREGHSLYRQQQENGMWGSVPPRASVPSVNLDLPNGPRLDGNELRRLVSDIFREAAILFLHTELSDLRPQVAEIKRAVKDTVEALKKLPCSEYDRSLVFPLALVGCATDEPDMREYVRCRIKQLSSAVGNCATAGELIEHVWARRDKAPGIVLGWREAMQEIGMTILLV